METVLAIALALAVVVLAALMMLAGLLYLLYRSATVVRRSRQDPDVDSEAPLTSAAALSAAIAAKLARKEPLGARVPVSGIRNCKFCRSVRRFFERHLRVTN